MSSVMSASGCCTAEGRNGDDRRKASPILPHRRQLVDVLYPSRCFEDESVEPWFDVHAEFGGEGARSLEDFSRIVEFHGPDQVYFCRPVAEHPLRADIEDLDRSPRISGDAGERRAVECGILKSFGPEEAPRLGILARSPAVETLSVISRSRRVSGYWTGRLAANGGPLT